MSEQFPEKIPEKPSSPAAEQKEFAQKVKEARFEDRLSLLGFKREEMTEEEISKLRIINEKIEETDASWVVRVMDKLQRENLLESFKPEDVEKLQKIAQERGYDFQKEGIASSQVKELTLALKKKKAEEWWETFYKTGGTRGKERIDQAGQAEADSAKEQAKKEVTPKVEAEAKEAQTAEQNRGKTHEEIARNLVEHPLKALDVFKKGVGLKLEKAVIGFTTFWKKDAAKTLRELSWPSEKALGYPAGEVSKAVWTAGEFLEKRPGIKRLEKVLAMHAQLERLKKEGATPEQAAQLEKLLQSHKYAAIDEWKEIEDFNRWYEEKKKILDSFRTLGHLGKKLSRWAEEQQVRATVKKEIATQRKVEKTAEKF